MIKHFLAATLTAALATATLADTADGDAILGMTWEEVEEMARGGEVNFFLWGGSDAINQYVTDYIGGRLMEDYGITLNRVGLSDTAEAVNLVLSEVEAGVAEGSVDMIWINGENFRTMKQGDLAFCGYTEMLPNNALIDWGNPAIANDFGVPVDGCEVPWSTAQFAFAYDSARMDTPPTDIGAILDWARANPGQFTYPAPPDFNGAVFIRHVFYHVAGGHEDLLGPFDQELFDIVSAETWALLNDLEPVLWREGQTYPTSITQLDQLFANSEVGLTFNYEPATVGLNIDAGIYPPTTMGFALTDGTIGNTNYTLIPVNSANKAAALILQNMLLDAMSQYQKALPEVWGAAPAIDISRTPAEVQALFAGIEAHPNTVDRATLSANALPELSVDWIAAIEAGWLENVGN